MSRQILKLKNFQTSARIRLPTTTGTIQAKRSLALYNTNSQFRLVNKEPHTQQEAASTSSKSTHERPTIYSDGEVETAGPAIRV